VDDGHDFIQIHVLFGTIALRAGHYGGKCFLLVLDIGQRHDAGSRDEPFHTADLCNAIAMLYVQIQQDDIRVHFGYLCFSLLAILCHVDALDL